MADYYVSADGDDSNAGTHAAPWKTLARVNTAVGSGGIAGRGSRVLFRRGDTFYGKLRPSQGLNPALPGWLKFGAYGDDPARPILSGYKVLNTASGWVQHDIDTWKINISAANAGTTYTGCDVVGEYHGDVAFLKTDGIIRGAKKLALEQLANQWDFYSDYTTDTLYVRSTAKPTTLVADVRCSYDLDGTRITYAIEIAGLNFNGYGANGIYILGDATRLRVLGNEVGEIGGAVLDARESGWPNTDVHYGNGITTWNNITNIYCERNIVHDVFDTAWSIQGGSNGVSSGFTDVTWRRNLTYRCSQAEEYWYKGSGPGFVNCISEYNTNLFCGYGFGGDNRPVTDVRVGQLSYPWGDPGYTAEGNLHQRRNIYYDCRSAFSYHSPTPVGMGSDRNVILLRPGTKMQWQHTQTVEQAANWAQTHGRDGNSIIGILPASAVTDISDTDVTAAIADLDNWAKTGQRAGDRIIPIHAPWRAA